MHWSALECRLPEDDPRVDYMVSFGANEEEMGMLAKLPDLTALYDKPEAASTWAAWSSTGPA